MNMHIHQLDVSNAFCYANNIKGDVYNMAPTPDFDLPSGHCLQLEKSLYGLHMLPRLWQNHLDRIIGLLNPYTFHRVCWNLACIMHFIRVNVPNLLYMLMIISSIYMYIYTYIYVSVQM